MMSPATTSSSSSTAKTSWFEGVSNTSRIVFYLILLVVFLSPAIQLYRINAARTHLLQRFQDERKSRVIGLIHRQDTVGFLGIPVSSYISIEDSEAVLRAIRLTPPEQPIDVILHTPGGLVLAAEQIATALAAHKGKVTVFVPHYAMSGGTLIALAADQIVMDPNAVLGPVDPQLGQLPAASIVKILDYKKPEQASDLSLIVIDIAKKARAQVDGYLADLLSKHYSKDKAQELASTLSEGRWTHDYPITVQAARSLGISVSTDMPQTVYELMDLYPQAGSGRPSVLYIPLRHGPGGTEEGTAPADGRGTGERR